MLELRTCFEHWHTRLRKAFKGSEYTFAKELLNHISRHESIEVSRLIDLAAQFKTGEHYREIINALVYDGYISKSGEPGVYRFNSPLLKMWWFKNVAY